MNPLASPPYSTDSLSLASLNSNGNIDPQMRALLAATWQVLDQVIPLSHENTHSSGLPMTPLSQPPPPSLREILAAYKQRGDGDREMLLAMLNAKSAEDQVRCRNPKNTSRTRSVDPVFHPCFTFLFLLLSRDHDITPPFCENG